MRIVINKWYGYILANDMSYGPCPLENWGRSGIAALLGSRVATREVWKHVQTFYEGEPGDRTVDADSLSRDEKRLIRMSFKLPGRYHYNLPSYGLPGRGLYAR